MISANFGRNRRPPGEFRRDLDKCLVDQNSDWIEIRCVGFQAETLRFERYGAAAGEGIEFTGSTPDGNFVVDCRVDQPSGPACGLGFEAAFLVLGVRALRRGRRRARRAA